MRVNSALCICREFGHGDDANTWRKSTKEADKDKKFYCNLESKILFYYLDYEQTGWLINLVAICQPITVDQ